MEPLFFWERAAQITNDVCIIDCWNGFSSDRKAIINRLTVLGVEKIICWQFVTSFDVCLRWFFEKKDVGSYSENSCKRDYYLYHEKACRIAYDGFDSIRKINPLQLTFPGFRLV